MNLKADVYFGRRQSNLLLRSHIQISTCDVSSVFPSKNLLCTLVIIETGKTTAKIPLQLFGLQKCTVICPKHSFSVLLEKHPVFTKSHFS